MTVRSKGAEAQARYRAKNEDRLREEARIAGTTPEARERRRQRRRLHPGAEYKKYVAEHPEKARAHSCVGHRIKTGELRRQPCEVCGAERVHAHHDDYSKPLEVRWLCPAHHALHHRQLRQQRT